MPSLNKAGAERVQEEPKQDLTNLTIQYREFEALLSSRAWAQLVGALQSQADGLQQQIIFSTVESTSDIYRLERLKGQLMGILALSATAQSMKEDMELQLNMDRQEES